MSDDEDESWEEFPTFQGTCTCKHEPDDHSWGTCNKDGCNLRSGVGRVITFPIKRGTARRLGIRQPPAAPQWLIDMASEAQILGWQLDTIERSYRGGGGLSWRILAALIRQQSP